MTRNRFRFTVRQLLVLTVAIAGLTALLVSFGPHFFLASKHVIVQEFPAMTTIENRSAVSDRELSACSFNGLSFDVPTNLIGTARIVRSSSTDVWLVFEDSTSMLGIPLVPTDMRAMMAKEPSEIENLSTPKLLELVVSAASGDFSLRMSRSDLRVHDWAMETRTLLNLDAQQMDRYSRISRDDIEAILISADPASIDSNRRIRSILAWESADHQSFGFIWFGDSRNVDVGWIEAVARSLTLDSIDRLTPSKLLALTDAEMLSQLKVTGPNER